MTDLTTWIWFAFGLLAGWVHSTMLWHGVQEPNVWTPVLGLLRVGIVATVLLISALDDAIIECAGGWIINFAWLGLLQAKMWDKAGQT